MKQQITTEQFGQLNDEQCRVILAWLTGKGYQKQLTLGQIIELIEFHQLLISIVPPEQLPENLARAHEPEYTDKMEAWLVETVTSDYYGLELCDALWEVVVKEI